jgi:transposase
MADKRPFTDFRAQAVALRRAGKSRREIKEILGVGSNRLLDAALDGVPPQPGTRRPRAKDDLHARARELRAAGHTYAEIGAELGVSKSSISLWVRDLPRPDRLSDEETRKWNADGVSAYWAARRSLREAGRCAASAEAKAQIGQLSDRELLIAGAIAYWCEGSKNKPCRRWDRVKFINSDLKLISFVLRFLAPPGVTPDRLICRVQIHESADVGAERFWQEVTGLPADQFRGPTVKHHNPKAVRKNIGESYRGAS